MSRKENKSKTVKQPSKKEHAKSSNLKRGTFDSCQPVAESSHQQKNKPPVDTSEDD